MSMLLGTEESAVNAAVGRTVGTSLMQQDAEPGFMEGAGTAAIQGPYRGISRGAAVAANTFTPALRPVAQSFDEIFGTKSDAWLLEEQAKANRSLIDSKIDAQTTGMAGQVLYGLGDVLTTVVSTGGNPWAAGALYGTSQAGIGIMDEGLDTQTAIMKGTVEGIGMGVGVALPAALAGSLAYRLATGAGLNVAQGVATRAGVATVLNTSGYGELAKQYEAFGVTDMLIDGVLGATFGGFMGKVKPSDLDAALVRQAQAHTELGTAPGIPVDAVSRNAHVTAVDLAREQSLRGEDVEVSRVADRATFAREGMPPEVAAAVREVESTPELAAAMRELDEVQALARARGLDAEDAPLYSRGDGGKVGGGETVFKPINVESPEFKQWHNESKVVDAAGDPLVVYHGTKADISRFIMGDEGGTFFTDATNNANEYAGSWPGIGQADDGNVIPAYLSIKRPYSVTNEQWQNNVGLDPHEAKAAGYDGYVITGQDGGNTYIAFSPTQIKSAISNTGAFDPNNSDIRISRGESSGSSISDLTSRFRAEFGKDADRLTEYARVEFVQSVADLPGGPHPADVRGMYWQGRSYIVADNVPPDAIKGLMLHEVGTHAGFHTMLGGDLYASVMNQIDARIAEGDAVFQKAREIAEQRANRPEHIREETLAYLVEAAPDLPFVRRILAQVRQWLYRQTGGRFVNLNADDMAAMTVASLRVYARQAEAEALGGAPMYSDGVVARGGSTVGTQGLELARKMREEGAKGVEELTPDRIVDDERIPTITLKDLLGKRLFPTIADRTAAGVIYKGIDSTKPNVAIELLGGPNFPLRESNMDAGVVWANRGKEVASQKGNKVAAGADHMIVLMGDANMHQSNTTVANVYFSTLEAYVRDARISADNVAAISKTVSEKAQAAVKEAESEIAQADARIAEIEAKLKTEGVSDQEIAKHKDIKKAKKERDNALSRYHTNNTLQEFKITTPEALEDFVHTLSFNSRSRLLDILGNKEVTNLGAPSMTRILDVTREPSLAGHRWGDGVLVVKIDKDKPFIQLGDDGTRPHPDFPLGIRGEVVGKLETPVNYETLWQDWLKQASESKLAENPSAKLNLRRGFELAKPEIEITQDLLDRIGDIRGNNLDGHRQAKMAVAMTLDRWRTSDAAKNKGGASPTDFTDAINDSPARVVLTEYTPAQVKADIKKGTMRVFQLGDETSGIWFALKKGNPAKEYGVDIAGLSDNEVTLTSVINNEQGARGIAGPAVVLKSLQEGATVIDAFAVKSDRFPTGFLSSMYQQFGFEEVGRIPFDPQRYSPQKLADAEKFWAESSPGWSKETHGYPDVVIMKWKGSDAERADITRRYLRDGAQGILSRGDLQVAEADWSVFSRRSAEEAGAGDGAYAGRVGGDQGTGYGTPLASRARGVVSDVAGLSDAEARNLGLDVADVAAVRSTLGGAASYSREADLQSIRDAANQPLGTALDDNPDMRIPDDSGAIRSAVDVAADAADEIQRMNDLSKGFAAAVECAFRFGT